MQAGRAGRWGAGAGQVLGARLGAQGARGACVGRASGSWAKQALGAGRAGTRQARARAEQARGLALGSALGALGPFSIRFDSFFFLSHQMNTVHCKISFFSKKKLIFIKFK